MGQRARVLINHPTGKAPLDLGEWWDLDKWPGARITVEPQYEINGTRLRIDYKGQVRFLFVSDEYVSSMMPDISDLKMLVHNTLEAWEHVPVSTGIGWTEMDDARQRWEQYFGL